MKSDGFSCMILVDLTLRAREFYVLCWARKCYHSCPSGGIQPWIILKLCLYPESTLFVQCPRAAAREQEGGVDALLTKPEWECSVSRAVKAAYAHGGFKPGELP